MTIREHTTDVRDSQPSQKSSSGMSARESSFFYSKKATVQNSKVLRVLAKKSTGLLDKEDQDAGSKARRATEADADEAKRPARKLTSKLSDIWANVGSELDTQELDAFHRLIGDAQTEEEVERIRLNMEVVKSIVLKQRQREYLQKKRTTLHADDHRPIRWVLKFEDEPAVEKTDLLDETTVKACCENIRQSCYDCWNKSRNDDETDYRIINERSYFEQTKSNLDQKIEKDKRAVRNWKTINLRLALYRTFKRKVSRSSKACQCFSAKKLERLQTQAHKFNSNKAWRHKAHCYLNNGNAGEEFRQLMTIHSLDIVPDDRAGEPKWWHGRYTMNPENIVLQLWVQLTTWIYLVSLISSTIIIAFDFWFLDIVRYYECFFDLIMLSDIILVFFTACELPKRDEARRKANHMTKDVFQRYEYNMVKIA